MLSEVSFLETQKLGQRWAICKASWGLKSGSSEVEPKAVYTYIRSIKGGIQGKGSEGSRMMHRKKLSEDLLSVEVQHQPEPTGQALRHKLHCRG